MSAPLHIQARTKILKDWARALTEQGKSNREVGAIIGVPRQRIQRWLHNQEEPTSHRNYMRAWAAAKRGAI